MYGLSYIGFKIKIDFQTLLFKVLFGKVANGLLITFLAIPPSKSLLRCIDLNQE